MTFTKEQLIERAKHLKDRFEWALAAVPGRKDAGMDLRLAEIALASLEAEPVGEVVLGEYDDCGCHPDARVVCIAADGQADWENFKDGTRLFTAPPAPVSVPDFDEWSRKCGLQISLCDPEFRENARYIWDEACRTAMLQGAEPVSQRDELTDDTHRLDWLDAQNKRLNEYHGTTYGWKFDANFQRNAMMLNDSNCCPVMTVREAIDEAIAAEPQQEVK